MGSYGIGGGLLSAVNKAIVGQSSSDPCDVRVLRRVADFMWDNEIESGDPAKARIDEERSRVRDHITGYSEVQKRLWMLSYEAIYTLLEGTYTPEMLGLIMNEIADSCSINPSATEQRHCVPRAIQVAFLTVLVPQLTTKNQKDVKEYIEKESRRNLSGENETIDWDLDLPGLFKDDVPEGELSKLHLYAQLNCKGVLDRTAKELEDAVALEPKPTNAAEWRTLLCGARNHPL